MKAQVRLEMFRSIDELRPATFAFAIAFVMALAIWVLDSGSAFAADCNPGEHLVDEEGNPLCWPAGVQDVCFNPALSAALETGTAMERWLAFQKAVDDWNVALAAVESPIKLRAVGPDSTDCWAVEQSLQQCEDAPVPVYDYNWLEDGRNATSTAKPTQNPGFGAGWIFDVESGLLVGSQLPQTVEMEVLGRARPNEVDAELIEADIAWMTHWMNDLFECNRIPWNFDHTNAPGAFPGEYDFYSVMLHELGHFLGLGHAEAGETGVMRPTLDANTRSSITEEEKECLKECIPAPSPTRAVSWGEVKSLFR